MHHTFVMPFSCLDASLDRSKTSKVTTDKVYEDEKHGSRSSAWWASFQKSFLLTCICFSNTDKGARSRNLNYLFLLHNKLVKRSNNCCLVVSGYAFKFPGENLGPFAHSFDIHQKNIPKEKKILFIYNASFSRMMWVFLDILLNSQKSYS